MQQSHFVHPGDVSDEKYVKRLVEDTITKLGKLDVFVNNAAIAIFGPFAQTTTQDWRKLMATDLDSVYFGSREALPHLLKTKGTIINVSSASGLGGEWGAQCLQCGKGRYYPTLRAPRRLSTAPAACINTVAPSLTSTEATVDLEKSEAVMAAFRDRLPIGRAATPNEVAGVIVFSQVRTPSSSME